MCGKVSVRLAQRRASTHQSSAGAHIIRTFTNSLNRKFLPSATRHSNEAARKQIMQKKRMFEKPWIVCLCRAFGEANFIDSKEVICTLPKN